MVSKTHLIDQLTGLASAVYANACTLSKEDYRARVLEVSQKKRNKNETKKYFALDQSHFSTQTSRNVQLNLHSVQVHVFLT